MYFSLKKKKETVPNIYRLNLKNLFKVAWIFKCENMPFLISFFFFFQLHSLELTHRCINA